MFKSGKSYWLDPNASLNLGIVVFEIFNAQVFEAPFVTICYCCGCTGCIGARLLFIFSEIYHFRVN